MKCPGQDMQYWSADAIYDVDCPKCGKSVEFYKDDTNRKCHHCGHRFVNPNLDFGCAAYCQYAEQCLGTLPEEFTGSQDNLLKDKIAVEVKRHLKSDFKRIGHATRVARYAEKIGKAEGANMPILLCSAYLQTLSNCNAEGIDDKHKAAREILAKLKAKDEIADLVVDLLRQDPDDSLEAKILVDAQKLAQLEDQMKNQEASNPDPNGDETISTLFTDSGKTLGQDIVKGKN